LAPSDGQVRERRGFGLFPVDLQSTYKWWLKSAVGSGISGRYPQSREVSRYFDSIWWGTHSDIRRPNAPEVGFLLRGSPPRLSCTTKRPVNALSAACGPVTEFRVGSADRFARFQTSEVVYHDDCNDFLLDEPTISAAMTALFILARLAGMEK